MATISATLPYPTPVSIKIFDITGRELYDEHQEHAFTSFNRQLDLSNLPQGTYIVQVAIDDNVKVLKWVVGK
jgi:hypothetical protein